MTTHTELTASDDQYKVISMSTGHLSPKDTNQLIAIVEGRTQSPLGNMVLERDTGWFLKIYQGTSAEFLERHLEPFSDTFKALVQAARDADFEMIEFDSDATVYESFPTFEW